MVFLVASTLATVIMLPAEGWSDDREGDQNSGAPLTREDARKLKSPVPYTKASIARGKVVYTRHCIECHGADGKSQVDVISDATDLTNPKAWRSGISEGEIFRTIRDGAGEAMPPFAADVSKSEDLWHMVNFVRSLWPDSARPKLTENTAH
jgi:mono/diheme cytochrome c family protein